MLVPVGWVFAHPRADVFCVGLLAEGFAYGTEEGAADFGGVFDFYLCVSSQGSSFFAHHCGFVSTLGGEVLLSVECRRRLHDCLLLTSVASVWVL